MKHHYQDITERIPEPPKWHDENGTPRYRDFAPGEQSDIYADEVALVLIACQNCRTQFRVCMSSSKVNAFARQAEGYGYAAAAAARKGQPAQGIRLPEWQPAALAASIRDGSLHYGDPPNVGCCGAGASMNCEDLRVLEYWVRFFNESVEQDGMTVVAPAALDWRRDAALEIELPDAREIGLSTQDTRASGAHKPEPLA